MSLSHFTTFCIAFLTLAAAGRAVADEDSTDARARRFIQQYEAHIRPLEIEVARTTWNADITGTDEAVQKKEEAEVKLSLALADPEHFAELKAIKEAGASDPLLAREIVVLYLEYLEKQVPPELLKQMLAKSNATEHAFNVFRAKVDGKELTDNEMRRVLIESRDSAQCRAAWEASKKVGRDVLADFKDLLALRNQAAHKLGFKDFYVMELYLNEQDDQQVLKLFDELDDLTRGQFHQAKAEMDAALAQRYNIAVADLRPWHYQEPFFQEPPAVGGELPESVYKDLDIVGLVRTFYDGVGLPIDDIIKRSDLFEKPRKNQHAYEQDMDREGDIRVLENIVPNAEWLGTTLHEFGHSVYSKAVDRAFVPTVAGHTVSGEPIYENARLPYVVRVEAHTLSTEAVAMMFERKARNVDWLLAMGVKVPDPESFRAAAAKLQRNRLLVFSRWTQVMMRFERGMYANPDQDLNKLWWDLVEKYQELKRPEGRNEPDYAAKYHIVNAPVYYHNYELGELFASQLHHALVKAVTPEAAASAKDVEVGNKAVGKFMREKVFAPGRTLDWNQLSRHATGEDLNPKAFAEDLKAAE